MHTTGILVLGDQLFEPHHFQKMGAGRIFMAEDFELCERFQCHKHKLIFFLSGMRHHALQLEQAGHKVDYCKLTKGSTSSSFEDKLGQWIAEHKLTELAHFEIVDPFFQRRIDAFCTKQGVVQKVFQTPMFLEEASSAKKWMKNYKRPFMKNYYEERRKKTGYLMEGEGGALATPLGGQFSFDEDNRKALPKGKVPPTITMPKPDEVTLEVANLVDDLFSHHPGDAKDFWLPVDSNGVQAWLAEFLEHRFQEFGDYEDALSPASPFLFHSVLSPFINSGLLTPDQVLKASESAAERHKISLNSREGFVRQILGWREFIRGIHLAYEKEQHSRNFFGHTRKLAPSWWNGTTGLLHLDRAIHKVTKWGYCHHIERLMVIGNAMLLCEIDPREAHGWFMQMFVDSADWVMGPNVYGMALWSDGGLFATKPYICGSNYWLKMSGEKKEPWCDDLDALYWSFVGSQHSLLIKNPRMSMMAKTFEKMEPARKEFLLERAEKVKARLTI